MAEHHFTDGPDGPGGNGAGDETDDRIRALLARAVASAPAPPSPDDVRSSDLPAVRVVLRASGSAGRSSGTRRRARTLRAVAASVAVVVLALGGAVALGGLDGRDPDDQAVLPGDGLPRRYVPTEVPSGLRLTAVDLSAGPVLDPTPEVTVYEGPGDVRVRIAAGPTGWAARAAGPTPNGPPATSPPGTTPPGTGGPATTGGPTTTDTTPPTTPDTTTGPPTSPGMTGPTTTVPAVDAASLPNVPGVPGRPDIQATTIRGAVGGLEAHDPTTTTAWFQHQGQLVAVDVVGLAPEAALGLVERLGAAASDGHLVPAPEDGLQLVATSPARPAGAESPASVQLVYAATEGQEGGPAFVVTTTRLAPGEPGGGHAGLLAATAGSFGRIERWGDRQVLVDDGLDNGATTRVSFVDPAGVLVTVLGPAGDLRPYVDGLVPAHEEMWDQVVAPLGADVETTSATDPRQ